MAVKTDAVLRAAEQVLELAKSDETKLQSRLKAGFFDLFRADVAAVRSNGDVLTRRTSKKAATISQNDAVRDGAELVSAIRATVRTGAPTNKTLWKAFGVGVSVSRNVRSVSAALNVITAAAAKYPAETAAVGLLTDDFQRVQDYAAAIATADSSQEVAKLTSKQTTAQLKAAQARLLDGLAYVAAIARLALPADRAAQYAALVPKSGRKSAPATPAQ
jgi:hypothetical protein